MKKFFTLLLLGSLCSTVAAQIPNGYYAGTENLSGAALKSKLSSIISAGAKDKGYDGLYTGYPTTDSDHYYENDGTVLDMYSENPTGTDSYNYRHGAKKCGNYSSEGDCYNREHVVPQSLFGSRAPMVSDIHHIRPTDGKVNGMRSNYPFGEVSAPSFTSKNGSKLGANTTNGYSGTVFEPINEFKGDVARMIFYFVTRYESQLSGFSTGNLLGGSAFPGLQTWELNVLMKWSAQDPVSPTEIERNNAAYAFQGNRNPYIDHPEWVQQVWGSGTVTTDTQAPSAPANLFASEISTASVTLSWNASADNIAVTNYKIYVNGVYRSTSATPSATVTGLSQGTSYTFYVTAVDAAGNTSPQSNKVSVTTLTDTVAPTAPTNLTLISSASNSLGIQWNAATDNVAVANYDIYVDGMLNGSTTTTSTNVANLSPATTYTIYVVAKDAAGNVSPQSNTISGTTAAVGSVCGDENFETIPTASSAYKEYNWSSNGISWTSEDSRTDLALNGRAIAIRNGFLTALSVPNGISDLTVTTQLNFSGSAGNLNVLVNGQLVGTIPYSSTPTTTTVKNINIPGSVDIKLENTATGNRVAIDDMKWSCYTRLATNETAVKNSISISPNPVRNGELNVSGKDLAKIEKVEIFNFAGQLVQATIQPFKNSEKLKLNNLPKGVYLLKAGTATAKFIVQ